MKHEIHLILILKVWSVSHHGPTTSLVDKLRPLLHKYKVTAYLCGHDHSLQHIADDFLNHTVHYIVSGAGALNDPLTPNMKRIPKYSLKFEWHRGGGLLLGGLGLVRVDEKSLNLTFFRSRKVRRGDGKFLYETMIYPRKEFMFA